MHAIPLGYHGKSPFRGWHRPGLRIHSPNDQVRGTYLIEALRLKIRPSPSKSGTVWQHPATTQASFSGVCLLSCLCPPPPSTLGMTRYRLFSLFLPCLAIALARVSYLFFCCAPRFSIAIERLVQCSTYTPSLYLTQPSCHPDHQTESQVYSNQDSLPIPTYSRLDGTPSIVF